MKKLLFLLLVLLLQGNTPQNRPAIEEKRIALLIGNSAYQHISTLSNPVLDVTAIDKALKELGFETMLKTNLNFKDMKKSVDDFTKSIQAHKASGFHVTALVYYAGHGVQHKEQNFLLPTDVNLLECDQLEDETYKLKKLEVMTKSADVRILMIDACRTPPKGESCLRDLPTAGLKPISASTSDVQTPIQLPQGCLISYSAEADKPAQDGEKGKNSPYAEAFLELLRQQADTDANVLYDELTNKVWLKTNRVQSPWKTGSIKGGKFYFRKPTEKKEQPKPVVITPDKPKDEPKKEIAEKKEFPKSYTETVNGVSFEMIYVEGGKFNYQGKKPIILDGFYVGKFEVTQKLWRAVMGSDSPELYNKGCDECPVESVSWNDIMNDFLPKLNKLTGKTYTLPTEAEWEYSARGGQQSKGYAYAGSNDIYEVAWYRRNYMEDTHGTSSTHPVGKKISNEVGLHDMSGNVWEWCLDAHLDGYEILKIPDNFRNPVFANGALFAKNNSNLIKSDNSENKRQLRGGSWYYYDDNYYVLTRNNEIQHKYGLNIGFRVVCFMQ